MQELMRTNDTVVVGLARSLLEAEGLLVMVADDNMSVLEGSIGMFPRRLLVVSSELEQARALLSDAGLGEWLMTT
jgi:hypothetical protein